MSFDDPDYVAPTAPIATERQLPRRRGAGKPAGLTPASKAATSRASAERFWSQFAAPAGFATYERRLLMTFSVQRPSELIAARAKKIEAKRGLTTALRELGKAKDILYPVQHQVEIWSDAKESMVTEAVLFDASDVEEMLRDLIDGLKYVREASGKRGNSRDDLDRDHELNHLALWVAGRTGARPTPARVALAEIWPGLPGRGAEKKTGTPCQPHEFERRCKLIVDRKRHPDVDIAKVARELTSGAELESRRALRRLRNEHR